MYTLKILADFAAAHSLRDYPGDCNRMHGHNWKIEVEVCGTELDDVGMVVDFRDIKKSTREIAKRLDHRFLNEVEPFDKLNPTAENLARYFHQQLSNIIENSTTWVEKVTLWETDRAAASFSRPGKP